MRFQRRTAQMLHEDHQATIVVIEALDQLIAKAKRNAPDISDPAVYRILNTVAGAIREEINAHFAFEEDELFPRLEAAGDVGIGIHLREEHAAILPLGMRVSTLATEALETGFSTGSWHDFTNQAAELIERMFAHIQKEEMALLPMLDDLLDSETDMALSTAYANNH